MGNALEDDDLTPDALEALNSDDPIEHEGDEPKPDKKSIKHRIGKEVEKTRLERERADQLERELQEAKKRLSGYEKQQIEQTDAREDELIEAKKKALDEGDLERYDEIRDELEEVRFNKRMRKQAPQAEEQEQPSGRKQAEAAAAWTAENRDWFGKDQEKTRRAVQIERELREEGYSVSDPDLYKELNKRLAGGNESEGDDSEFYEEESIRNTPPPPPRDRGSNTPRGKVSRRMTAEDVANMRRFQMDPEDPQQRKQYMMYRNGDSL